MTHRVGPLLHLPLQPSLYILGNHPETPTFQGDAEIWVFNGKGASLPRYDMVFQMHLECDWGGIWSRNWLRNNTTIPVMMREVHDDIPASVQYPFEKVFAMLEHVRHRGKPLEYFTSSIAWAIALAVLQERPRIFVKGVEFAEHEYEKQKDCFAFWTGFAGGRGIELDIDCADAVFRKPLYGSYPLQQKAIRR